MVEDMVSAYMKRCKSRDINRCLLRYHIALLILQFHFHKQQKEEVVEVK